MKNFVRHTMICLLAAVTLMVTMLLPYSAPASASNTPNQQEKGNGYKHRSVKGEAVGLRAKELRDKNKGVARAMKDLEKKGFRAAWDKGISLLDVKDEQTARSASGSMQPASFKSQSQAITDNGYEMTFISYDDGNPNTWEGVIYEHDPNMFEYSYTASIDISGDPSTWARIEETYYPVDGSTPISSSDPLYNNPSYTPYDPMYDRNPLLEMPVSKADSPVHHNVRLTKATFIQGRDRRWHDRLGRWLRCAGGGCLGAAITCVASGPAWPVCYAWGCLGVEAACVIFSW